MTAMIDLNTHYILQLADVSAEDAPHAGAKATNEALLMKAGFLVPEGMVLTTAAFEDFLTANDPNLTSPSETIMNAPLPVDVVEALQSAATILGDMPLAVRSSAGAEDMPDASFAGQYETILNVQGFEAIAAAVRRCWASVFNVHVVAYRNARGLERSSIAVLLQQLVPADTAGVAFTSNPVSGERDEVVINAVRGLGERLVSGEASPDEWTVSGEKTICHRAPEAALDADLARLIAETARQVEAFLGHPQDIEWAMKDGQLFILQARPITTLIEEGSFPGIEMVPISIHESPGFWQRDASHFPQAVYPMSRLLIDPIRTAVKRWVDEYGFLIDGLELQEIGGWMYQRLVPFGGKDRPPPPSWVMRLMVRLMPSIRGRINISVDAIRDDKPGHFIQRWHTVWQPELASRIAALRDVDLAELSDEALNDHIESTVALFGRAIEIHAVLHGSLAIILYELSTTCQDLLGWSESQAFELVNGTSFKSTEPARQIHVLAQMARERPAIMRLLESADWQTVNRITEVDETYTAALAAYMKEFGCRAIRYEIAEPTLAETPSLVLSQIRNQIRRGYDHDANDRALAQKRTAVAAEARSRLAQQPAELKEFDRVLKRAEQAYPVREDNEVYTLSAPFALIRYALLEMGLRLAGRDVIAQRDDVFFLEIGEARSAFTGGGGFHEKVRHRQAQRAWAMANPGPPAYGVEPPQPPSFDFLPPEARLPMEAMLWSLDRILELEQSQKQQTKGEMLKGIAVSPGQYTGPARLIMDEGEFGKLQSGDVLVCPITSPVWSVLFPSVGALVTDSGGILSHPAIISREYQVPAVVALGNATSLLKDGQIVIVNGSTGTVSIPPQREFEGV